MRTSDRHRKGLRLSTHDYSGPGGYFVTFCVEGRECLLGRIVGDAVELSDVGTQVLSIWNALPDRFPTVSLDELQIMPNHVHAIIFFSPPVNETERQQSGTQQAASLPNVMRAFKSISAIAANRALGRSGVSFWQERYHDRIIRDGSELERIRTYIRENPARWEYDSENPDNPSTIQ